VPVCAGIGNFEQDDFSGTVRVEKLTSIPVRRGLLGEWNREGGRGTLRVIAAVMAQKKARHIVLGAK